MARQARYNSTLVALGAAIARRRIELDLSQEQLANRAQVHRTYVSDVERGIRNVSVLTLERIAHALDMPMGALFAMMTVSNDGASDKKRR